MDANKDKLNIIIGAGLSGLTAAYMLARSGEKCLLLEKEQRIGGLTQSLTIRECLFDLGPHGLLCDNSSRAIELIKILMRRNEYLIINWKMNFFMNGKYFGFPLRATDLIRLPLSYSTSLLKGVMIKRPTNNSFKAAIISSVGTKMYHNFFAPFINKKTADSRGGEELHEDWWRRAKRNYKNEVIRRMVTDKTESDRKNKLSMKFLLIADKLINVLRPKSKMFYPKKGIEVIPNKLWEFYEKSGGQTLCSVNDIKLIALNNRIHKVIANGNQYHVKNLIWTGRVTELCNQLSLECEDLKYISCGLVFIVLTRRRNRFGRGVAYTYYPEPDIIFSRVYYPSYFCEEMAPKNRDALCVEVTVENEIGTWSPEMIIEKTKADLQRLGICEIEEIEAISYKKLSQVYPIYPLDYESKLKKVYGALKNYRNLYPIGRLGAFYFCMMYDAINQGIETAEYILSQEKKS